MATNLKDFIETQPSWRLKETLKSCCWHLFRGFHPGPSGTNAIISPQKRGQRLRKRSLQSCLEALLDWDAHTVALCFVAVCARTKGLQSALLLIQLHKHEIYRHRNSSLKPFPLVMFSCWKVGTLLDMNVNKKKRGEKKNGQAFWISSWLPPLPPPASGWHLGSLTFWGECKSLHSI